MLVRKISRLIKTTQRMLLQMPDGVVIEERSSARSVIRK